LVGAIVWVYAHLLPGFVPSDPAASADGTAPFRVASFFTHVA
jgi:hypothetical protein